MKEPSESLKKLMKEWDDEVDAFRRAEAIYVAHCRIIGQLSHAIYVKCKEEGINEDELNLKK